MTVNCSSILKYIGKGGISMNAIEYNVVFNSQEQSSEFTADNDLLNEVVSMMAETTIYSEVKKIKIIINM